MSTLHQSVFDEYDTILHAPELFLTSSYVTKGTLVFFFVTFTPHLTLGAGRCEQTTVCYVTCQNIIPTTGGRRIPIAGRGARATRN